MALEDEVKSRFPAKFLARVTNPEDNSATAVDDPKLTLAATDVKADFETYLGRVYDSTSAQDVAVGVFGCVAKLRLWTAKSAEELERLEDEWLDRLRALSKRLLPKTNSTMKEPTQKTGKPDFDDDQFTEFVPNNTAAGDSWGNA